MKYAIVKYIIKTCFDCPHHGCEKDKILYCTKPFLPRIVETKEIPDWCELEDL